MVWLVLIGRGGCDGRELANLAGLEMEPSARN